MYLQEYPLINRLFWLLQHSCYALLFAQSFFLLSGYDCNSLICFLALQACYAPGACFTFHTYLLNISYFEVCSMDLSVPYNVPSLFRISLLTDLCMFRRISTPWLYVCTVTQLSQRLSAFIFLSAPADGLGGGLQSQRVIFYLMTSLMSCNVLHGISLTLHHVMLSMEWKSCLVHKTIYWNQSSNLMPIAYDTKTQW